MSLAPVGAVKNIRSVVGNKAWGCLKRQPLFINKFLGEKYECLHDISGGIVVDD